MQRVCGGTIVDSTTIISAAHCFEKYSFSPSAFVVVAGDYAGGGDRQNKLTEECSEQLRTISKIIWHPSYLQGSKWNNDIAVVKLAKPLEFNSVVQPACLPQKGSEVECGTQLTHVGWGRIGPSVGDVNVRRLQATIITSMSNQDCKRIYESKAPQYRVEYNILCARVEEDQRSWCSGDSGSPIIAGDPLGKTGFTLVGVPIGFGCDAPDWPGWF